MCGKLADGEANVIQAPGSVFELSLILAGTVIIIAVLLWQFLGQGWLG